jgi:hypothetical protein
MRNVIVRPTANFDVSLSGIEAWFVGCIGRDPFTNLTELPCAALKVDTPFEQCLSEFCVRLSDVFR